MLKNLKPFLALMRPYRVRVRLALLAGAIAGLGTGAGFSLGIKQLFGLIFSGERNLSVTELVGVASIFPLLFLAVGLATFLSSYHLNHVGLNVIRDLRQQLFEHIQAMPLAFFQRNKTGDLISRVTADTQLMQYALTITARDLVIQPLTFIGAISVLIYLGLQTEGIVYVYISILVLPVVIFPIRRLTQRLGKRAHLQQEELSSLTERISQNIGAAKEVRAFNLEGREIKRFAAKLGELFAVQIKVIKYTFALSPVVELISSIGLALAFAIGYRKGVAGEDFIAIFMALYFSYSPIKRISYLSGELRKGASSLERVRDITSQPIEISDPTDPVSAASIQGRIQFDQVSFSYDESPALRDVNTTIEPGTICALVGPSGAGKSTFANLVPRFYDATSGSVLVDGIDVRQLQQKQLRDQIAIVSQDPVLFDDSILENIRLGRQNATDSQVREAARHAFADEFVRQMPEGYETVVGERGARLSGGQKQRIAIARAFLRDAPILILDEATSALDSESEKMIQTALEVLVRGKTVLIIAHRFSTIKGASKILVFEEGRIVASGSHEELHRDCLLYRNLYDQQNPS